MLLGSLPNLRPYGPFVSQPDLLSLVRFIYDWVSMFGLNCWLSDFRSVSTTLCDKVAVHDEHLRPHVSLPSISLIWVDRWIVSFLWLALDGRLFETMSYFVLYSNHMSIRILKLSHHGNWHIMSPAVPGLCMCGPRTHIAHHARLVSARQI